MKEFILAIDQGTTSTTSALIDIDNFSFFDKECVELPQEFPSPGLVEHDLNEVWKTVEETVSRLMKKHSLSKKNIRCIGITNQRETVCPFKKDGYPLARAIVWQDRRTEKRCEELINSGRGPYVKEKTGLPIDPYFSATKMEWLMQNDMNIKEAYKAKDLCLGTIDSYLIYNLTGQQNFVTDATNASRYLLMDIKGGTWNSELISMFNMDDECLPQIKDSFGFFGETKNLSFLPSGIPITCVLGDQQAALMGQAGYEKGSLKCTYGTGAFVVLNVGEEIPKSDTGLLVTKAYQYKGKPIYALEGGSFISGAAIQWLRDQLGLLASSKEVEDLAREVKKLEEMKNLIFLPFFNGIGAPRWNLKAKGALLGITRDTGKRHLAKAVLDGMALSVNDLISAFKLDGRVKIDSLKVDGGAAANDLLLEIQANISNIPIIRPKIIETTAYGAALGAAIGCDLLKIEMIKDFWKEDKKFNPEFQKVEFYERKVEQWDEYIKKLF